MLLEVLCYHRLFSNVTSLKAVFKCVHKFYHLDSSNWTNSLYLHAIISHLDKFYVVKNNSLGNYRFFIVALVIYISFYICIRFLGM